MKKCLCLLLAVLLFIGMSACARDEAPVFQAGFGTGDISWTTPVPLAGGANSSERISTGFLSHLYAQTLAVSDGTNTALLMSVDAVALKDFTTDAVRNWAVDAYGIPRENIIISATHQHSCPDPYNTTFPAAAAYNTVLIQGMMDSVTKAMEDLSPAQMQINTVETEALTFVRNYIANDGSMVGDNYGSDASGLKEHESEADNQMRLLKFLREGAKDILLVNFQAHPHLGCSGENRYFIHSDWPGIMRDLVGTKLACNVIYFSGAGGNLNSSSRIAGETVSYDYRVHGSRAAEYVLSAEGSYTPIGTGSIRAKELTITCEADHSMDHLVDQARPVDSARAFGTEYAKEVMLKYPQIHSVFHATAILTKAAAGPTKDVTIGAVAIGDVVFTAHPYEMFDTNGMELRAGTLGNANYAAADQQENPYAMTFIATLSNGWLGYIPSQLGYTNGGYSTDITKYAAGTGEQLVTEYLRLLNNLHEQ